MSAMDFATHRLPKHIKDFMYIINIRDMTQRDGYLDLIRYNDWNAYLSLVS